MKRLQSLEVRSPRLESEADGRLNVSAALPTLMEKSVPAVDEEKVIAVAVVVE